MSGVTKSNPKLNPTLCIEVLLVATYHCTTPRSAPPPSRSTTLAFGAFAGDPFPEPGPPALRCSDPLLPPPDHRLSRPWFGVDSMGLATCIDQVVVTRSTVYISEISCKPALHRCSTILRPKTVDGVVLAANKGDDDT